jgi:thymidine phosphorylase
VRIDDEIDPSVGFIAELKIGDRVDAGAALGTIYCREESKAKEAAVRIQTAYEIDNQPPTEIPQLMREVINE